MGHFQIRCFDAPLFMDLPKNSPADSVTAFTTGEDSDNACALLESSHNSLEHVGGKEPSKVFRCNDARREAIFNAALKQLTKAGESDAPFISNLYGGISTLFRFF